MSPHSTPGARFALWWVEVITHTAEAAAARDRRAEIASDVHEQLTDAWSHDPRARSRAVLARVVRGAPSDVSWRVGLELRPSRFSWHLRNPSTAITTLLVALVPLNMAADSYVSDPGHDLSPATRGPCGSRRRSSLAASSCWRWQRWQRVPDLAGSMVWSGSVRTHDSSAPAGVSPVPWESPSRPRPC